MFISKRLQWSEIPTQVSKTESDTFGNYRKNILKLYTHRSLAALALLALSGLLIRVYLAYATPDQKSWGLVEYIFDIAANFGSGVASAVVFLALVAKKSDQEFQSHMQRSTASSVLEAAHILHAEFVPSGHYRIATETDPDLWIKSKEDFANTREYFYSGINAQLPLVRMFESQNQELRRVLLRLPISRQSIRKAVAIKRKLQKISVLESPNGTYLEKPKLVCRMALDQTDQIESELLSSTISAVCFAWYVRKWSNAEIAIRDWDETTNFRTEFMDEAVYIGNYHTNAVASRFSPGTARFSRSSFIHRIMHPSIESQISGAFHCQDANAALAPKINLDRATDFKDLTRFVEEVLAVALEPASRNDARLHSHLDKFGLSDEKSASERIKTEFDHYRELLNAKLLGRDG